MEESPAGSVFGPSGDILGAEEPNREIIGEEPNREKLWSELDALLTVLRRGVSCVRIGASTNTVYGGIDGSSGGGSGSSGGSSGGGGAGSSSTSGAGDMEDDAQSSSVAARARKAKGTKLLLTQRARAATTRFMHTETVLQRQLAAGVSITTLVVDCLPGSPTPFLSMLQHNPTRRTRKTAAANASATAAATAMNSCSAPEPSSSSSTSTSTSTSSSSSSSSSSSTSSSSSASLWPPFCGGMSAYPMYTPTPSSQPPPAPSGEDERGEEPMDEAMEDSLCHNFETGCQLHRMGGSFASRANSHANQSSSSSLSPAEIRTRSVPSGGGTALRFGEMGDDDEDDEDDALRASSMSSSSSSSSSVSSYISHVSCFH